MADPKAEFENFLSYYDSVTADDVDFDQMLSMLVLVQPKYREVVYFQQLAMADCLAELAGDVEAYRDAKMVTEGIRRFAPAKTGEAVIRQLKRSKATPALAKLIDCWAIKHWMHRGGPMDLYARAMAAYREEVSRG